MPAAIDSFIVSLGFVFGTTSYDLCRTRHANCIEAQCHYGWKLYLSLHSERFNQAADVFTFNLLRVSTIFIASLFFGSSAFADIEVMLVDENRLSYDLSPSNYDNSPSNYDNSVSNYDNSPSNYDNSASNYDNSSSNYENSIGGNRNIFIEERGRLTRMGYYTFNDSGPMNIYSTSGKRLFYIPAERIGVFEGEDGFFCGVLVRENGIYKIGLTRKGERMLYLGQ